MKWRVVNKSHKLDSDGGMFFLHVVPPSPMYPEKRIVVSGKLWQDINLGDELYLPTSDIQLEYTKHQLERLAAIDNAVSDSLRYPVTKGGMFEERRKGGKQR